MNSWPRTTPLLRPFLFQFGKILSPVLFEFLVVVVAFYLLVRNFGRMFNHSFLTCTFLKWRLARAHYFPSLCQDQSTVAQWAETTMAKCSLTRCVWARFRIGSHTMPGQRRKRALLAEWQGYFMCHCGNTGVERTPNKSQHTKFTIEKKILPPLMPRIELATFRSRVRCSYHHTIPARIESS